MDFERPYCLDNNRVLFIGYDPSFPNGPGSLYLWNLSAETIKRYRKNVQGLCVSGNYVRYEVHSQGTDSSSSQKTWYDGPFGNEVYSASASRSNETSDSRFNELSCTSDTIPEKAHGKHWIPLKPEHGYLVVGVLRGEGAMETGPMELRKPDGERLALTASGFDFLRAEYLPATNRYLLTKTNRCKKQTSSSDVCDVLWWIDPSGWADSFPIPTGPWAKAGAIEYFPLSIGVLLVSHAYSNAYDSGNAGAYMLRRSSYSRILAGKIRAVGASPSGCRVAMDHASAPRSRDGQVIGWFTLKVVDICDS
jgi:hypothetical protein